MRIGNSSRTSRNFVNLRFLFGTNFFYCVTNPRRQQFHSTGSSNSITSKLTRKVYDYNYYDYDYNYDDYNHDYDYDYYDYDYDYNYDYDYDYNYNYYEYYHYHYHYYYYNSQVMLLVAATMLYSISVLSRV